MATHIGEKSILLIDSKNRLSGTSTDFNYNILLPRTNTYDHVAVLQAVIPKSYYVIPAEYNTFTLVENGVNIPITIYEGNYSMVSFASVLGAILSASSLNNITYTIQYESIESLTVDIGKFVYSVSNNGIIQPQFIMPSSSFIPRCMGFLASSTNTFNTNRLYSANVVSFQSHDSLVLKSNMVRNENKILQEILSGSTPYNSSITYQNNNIEMNSKVISSANDNIYNFILVSSNNEIINLNGLDITFSIVLYSHNKTDELVANDIKIKHLKDQLDTLT